ncbi:MAG: CRISPR-associated endonuclease Cas1 [Gammaproteobacteria bacterium]|nr:CRISPR-associated endonuclease Cas1 [Gammaproteobacteria bacterium]
MDTAQQPGRLAVFGSPQSSMDIVLRKVLKRDRDAALAVLDYRGYAAQSLHKKNKGNLQHRKLLWLDLTNRRKPVAVFRLARSPCFRPLLRILFQRSFVALGYHFGDDVVGWLVEFCWNLTGEGRLTLGAVLRSLQAPQVIRSVSTQSIPAADVQRLTEVIELMLSYPGVWCLSESPNIADLDHIINAKGTLWIEFPAVRYQHVEHLIVALMVEVAILDAFGRRLAPHSGQPAKDALSAGLVLYAYPDNRLLSSDLSIASLLPGTRYLVVVPDTRGHTRRALSGWPVEASDCWVVGNERSSTFSGDKSWFEPDEISRLSRLSSSQLWTRSCHGGQRLTYRIRQDDHRQNLAQHYRAQAAKHLKLTKLPHFSSMAHTRSGQPSLHSGLYQQLCDEHFLHTCWAEIKHSRNSSHGSDGISIEQFGRDLEKELAKLATDLSQRSYAASPLRMVTIPKEDGSCRVLRIPTVRDRVVQAGCTALLGPLFETRFSPFSFAYRPGRNAHQAVGYLRSLINTGHTWVVRADIEKCFDSIDHDILYTLLAEVVADAEILDLIHRWLKTDAIDFWMLNPAEQGIPQGDRLSPLLANIFLHPLDRFFTQSDYRFARYADDFVVAFTTSEQANLALETTRGFLAEKLSLALKDSKTSVVQASQGIAFLGFEVSTEQVRIDTSRMHIVERKLVKLVQQFGSNNASFHARSNTLLHINGLVRGFRNYFSGIDSEAIATQMRFLEGTLEQLARDTLSVSLIQDAAWRKREKFIDDADRVDTAVMGSLAALPFAQYPEIPQQQHPSGWLMHDPPEDRPSTATHGRHTGGSANDLTDSASSDSDLFLDSKRLYLNGTGQFLGYSGEALVVKRKRRILRQFALNDIEILYLQGRGLTISVDLIQNLTERGIHVILSPLYGKPISAVSPIKNAKSHLRKLQASRAHDPVIVRVGLGMLAAKVANQASVLKYFAKYRRLHAIGEHATLDHCASELREIASTIKQIDPTLADISPVAMGHEGRAAAKYWHAIQLLVPKDFEFPGRHTQHATDRFNQSLNYLYGLLYGEVWRAVVNVGLDPYFGIMHGSVRDQGSLVFDLIEELRAPFVDRLLLGMVGRGFQPGLRRDGKLMKKPRRQLIAAFLRQWNKTTRWRTSKIAPSRLLERQAGSLAAVYLDDGRYQPFQFRW